MTNQAQKQSPVAFHKTKEGLTDRSKKSEESHVYLMFSVQFILLSLVKYHKPPILRLN